MTRRPHKPFKVAVEVAVPEGSEPASGTVIITREGETIARGEVTEGTGTIKVKTKLPRGEHQLEARYLGNPSIAASSDTLTVTVQ